MNKNKFLKILNDELKNYLDNSQLKYQLDYYNDYIDNEIKNGKKELDVISELGDPRLIAKTILQINNIDSTMMPNNSDNINDSDNFNNNSFSEFKYVNSNITIGCLIFFVLFLIILLSILRFLGYAFTSLFFISSPFSIVLLLILLYLILKK